MEDYLLIKFNFAAQREWKYFAVLDGHIDEKVAQFCSEELAAFLEGKIGHLITATTVDIVALRKAVEEAYIEFDEVIRRKGLSSGTTCTSVLIGPKFFLFANVGDSRSFLISDGQLRFETADHKPHSPEEFKRITTNGGFVRYGRVNGNLALSRAFGDFEFKRHYTGSMFQKSYNPLAQPVIAKPTIDVIEKRENDQIIVLGSDGIFDVFGVSDDLSKYVFNRFQVHGNAEKISEEVIDTCFARGSTDNMSVLLVSLAPDDKIRDKCAGERDAAVNALIEEKIKQFVDSSSYSKELSSDAVLYKIFLQIHKDVKINELLPPGALLSSKSALIKNLVQQYTQSKT